VHGGEYDEASFQGRVQGAVVPAHTDGIATVGHLVWRLLAERQGDLIQHRRDARIVVAVLRGGTLFIDLAADASFGFARSPLASAMTQNATALASGLWLAGRLLTFGVVEDAPLPAGTAPQPGIRHDGQRHCRLSGLMGTGRVFLDPGPTFIAFVERMAASPSTLLRWL
jgi:hypothetical protein